MMSTIHELKTWTEYFEALWRGDKTCEVRRDDRNYAVDDQLYLREWDLEKEVFLPRAIRAHVTHVLRGDFAPPGHVVMSFGVISRETVRTAAEESPTASADVEALPHALLWLDTETTGLDPKGHKLLEIAYVLTAFAFPWKIVTRGHYLIENGMMDLVTHADPFVQEMHAKSGLAAALHPNSTEQKTSLLTIEQDLLTLAQDWPFEDKSAKVLLAGNSVDFDRGFLRVYMPSFAKRLSHRVFDASSYYRFCRSLGMPAPAKPESHHRAADDVDDSIALAHTCASWVLGRR